MRRRKTWRRRRHFDSIEATAKGRIKRRDGVDDGARTRDSQNHNLELYQLSYIHRNSLNLPHPALPHIRAIHDGRAYADGAFRRHAVRADARATPPAKPARGGGWNMETAMVAQRIALPGRGSARERQAAQTTGFNRLESGWEELFHNGARFPRVGPSPDERRRRCA